MKIAICGSHGVGKSTLSEHLAKHLGIVVLPDIVIEAHHSGFQINEWSTLTTQVWLTAKQLENEKKHSSFIADKCIYDYHVYAKALSMNPSIVETTRLIALDVHDYTHVFYIAPEFELVDEGGLRSIDPVFQSQVHDTYKAFLEEHNISYVQLTWSIPQRVEQALLHISLTQSSQSKE